MAEYLQDDLRVFVVPVDIFEVPDLSMAEQMVYIVLRSHTNPYEPTAFPSYETIAKKARMSRRNAIRVVQSLTEKGLLKKEIRLNVTKNRRIRNTSNLYTIKSPKAVTPCHHPSDTMSPSVVTPCHHPSDTMSPEHNHLTKPHRTKPINNNKGKTITTSPSPQKEVLPNDPLPVVVELLNKHEIKINKTTLTKWNKLAEEQTIIQAVEDAFQRDNLKNPIGYITRMLEAGYTPNQTPQTKRKKKDLPDYLVKELEDGRKEVAAAINPDQQREALDLLFQLEEIDQEEYELRLKQI